MCLAKILPTVYINPGVKDAILAEEKYFGYVK
jgi:hypothetical protein